MLRHARPLKPTANRSARRRNPSFLGRALKRSEKSLKEKALSAEAAELFGDSPKRSTKKRARNARDDSPDPGGPQDTRNSNGRLTPLALACPARLEHDPEKWSSGFRNRSSPNKG